MNKATHIIPSDFPPSLPATSPPTIQYFGVPYLPAEHVVGARSTHMSMQGRAQGVKDEGLLSKGGEGDREGEREG